MGGHGRPSGVMLDPVRQGTPCFARFCMERRFQRSSSGFCCAFRAWSNRHGAGWGHSPMQHADHLQATSRCDAQLQSKSCWGRLQSTLVPNRLPYQPALGGGRWWSGPKCVGKRLCGAPFAPGVPTAPNPKSVVGVVWPRCVCVFSPGGHPLGTAPENVFLTTFRVLVIF
jgi:hypothetical protein